MLAITVLYLSTLGCISSIKLPTTPVKSQPVAGRINVDTLWKGNFLVTGDLLVPEGVTLTISSGSNIFFMPNRTNVIPPQFLFITNELLVRGRLVAQGTKEDPIVFTASYDDTSPMPGWAGIILDQAKTGTVIENCLIEYAEVGIYSLASSPKIAGNRLEYNNTGIICQQSGAPQIIGNSIAGSEKGISCFKGSSPLIRGNLITQNEIGIFWAAGATVKLEENIIKENKYGIISGKAATTLKER